MTATLNFFIFWETENDVFEKEMGIIQCTCGDGGEMCPVMKPDKCIHSRVERN
jgi:hypothetical protein